MGSREMERCRMCGIKTSGQRNDLFDGMLFDMKTLAGYIVDQRFNQAGAVLISSAANLMQTYNGCCVSDEMIQKYGKETIELIKLGMEISKLDNERWLNKD